MYVFTCPNTECEDYGVERLLNWDQIHADNAENGVEDGPVVCGTCGTDITDTARKVDDDYTPPVPNPDEP